MNLYELTEDFIKIQDLLEENGGEVTEDIEKLLEFHEDSFRDKATNYAKFIRQLTLEAELLEKEEKRLYAMRSAKLNLVDKLRTNLGEYMKLSNMDKVDLGLFKLSWRKSSAVSIIDEVPELYTRVVTSPDKTMIAQALKEGAPLSFAEIVETKHLQIL